MYLIYLFQSRYWRKRTVIWRTVLFEWNFWRNNWENWHESWKTAQDYSFQSLLIWQRKSKKPPSTVSYVGSSLLNHKPFKYLIKNLWRDTRLIRKECEIFQGYFEPQMGRINPWRAFVRTKAKGKVKKHFFKIIILEALFLNLWDLIRVWFCILILFILHFFNIS